MAATKVWKRFQKIEKGMLILLCVGMVMTLGIGGGMVFGSCGSAVKPGTAIIEGDEVSIDAIEYDQFRQRQFRFLRVFTEAYGVRPNVTEEEVERRFLLHLLAQSEGIRVSDDSVRQFVEGEKALQWNRGESFSDDAYEQTLARHKFQTKRDFEQAVREHFEIQQMLSNDRLTLGPTRKDVYADFKVNNKKVSVEYTWSPLEPYEAQVDRSAFTEEEMKAHYDLVKSEFQIPPRWKVESGFVVVAEIPDEKFTEFYEQTLADEALQKRYRELVGDEKESLRVTFKHGWNRWFRNESIYSDSARRVLELGKDGAEERDETPDDGTTPDDKTDESGTGEEAESGEGEPGEAPGDQSGEAEGDDEDESPTTEPAPAGEAAEPVRELSRKEHFRTYWLSFVRKEMFYERLAKLLVAEARVSETPFEDLVSKYGFRFHRSELVTENDLRTLPDIGSPALQTAVSAVKPADAGKILSVLPLTELDVEILERGWQIVRVVEAKAREPKPLEEIETEVRDRLFEKRVEKLGLEAMMEIKKEAEAPDAEFAKVAKDRGLAVRNLESFNENSPRPTVKQEELESEDEAVRQAAVERALDARVMNRGLSEVATLGGDRMVSNALVDPRTKSVLLIHLLGREDPGPEEMSEQDARRSRQKLLGEEFGRMGLYPPLVRLLRGSFGEERGPYALKALRERLKWKVPSYGEE